MTSTMLIRNQCPVQSFWLWTRLATGALCLWSGGVWAAPDPTTVRSIKIDGKNILYGEPAAAAGKHGDLAREIANHINACQAWSATNNPLPAGAKCETAGYSATYTANSSGATSTVRIYTPISGPRAYGTPAVTIATDPVVTGTSAPSANSMTVTPPTAAQKFVTASATSGYRNVPGVNQRVLVTKPFPMTPASTAPASPLFPHPQYSRDDCGGAACTYEKEMENLANWYAYYQTRLQLMKTSTSLAFQSLLPNNPTAEPDFDTNPTQYRLGFMTINNNNGADFLGVDDFAEGRIKTWYDKVFATKPNMGTPLRSVLSTAGRYFAGDLSTVNTVAANDPAQYSCQQNFAILFTDGTWTAKVDVSTPSVGAKLGGALMDNQDGTTTNAAGGTVTVPQLDRLDIGNTLADVAEYYYTMDLRTTDCEVNGQDVCDNDVPKAGMDDATWQHMTTLTLGLGASGRMQFDPAYLSATSGDYADVVNPSGVSLGAAKADGTKACPWQTTGTFCTWPDPVPSEETSGNEPQTRIDDLWHAAVNGRGTYYAVNDAASLAAGLTAVLTAIDAATSSGGASTPSVPNIVAGDDSIYSSTYVSQEWTGDLTQQKIDINTGEVKPAIEWSARDWLDSHDDTQRTIYTFDAGAATKLKAFAYAGLSATEKPYFEKAYIRNAASPQGSLSQFCTSGSNCLSDANQDSASGDKLVKYLRGDQTNVGAPTNTSKYFRERKHRLGDIVNSEAAFVGAPSFKYLDEGYVDFLQARQGRQKMVYVGANDGMLHAFKAADGSEAWAYVPGLALPSLYVLADKEYGNAGRHRYLVDGSPVVGDICPSAGAQSGNIGCSGSEWKTILVAGLGKGGRGFYALDITDPAAPKALWEFKDANLGYSYGNPIIAKLRDGTWVVIVTSGYNNVPDSLQATGDGQARLYILKADTGDVLRTIATGQSASIARINSWVDDVISNNTALRVYGGDEGGGLWRFDINGDYGAAGYDAQLLATLQDAGGKAQPITGRPELGMVGDYPVVFVGTGKLLGMSDLSDASVQSLYAVKDTLDATSFANPRSRPDFAQQTLTTGDCPPGTSAVVCEAGHKVHFSTRNAVNWSIYNGWFLDLPEAGERVNTDLALAYGILVANANAPDTAGACKLGGQSYRLFIDYRTGGSLKSSSNDSASGISGEKMADALTSRPVLGSLPNNKLISWSRLWNQETPGNELLPSFSGSVRRISWREIPTEQ